MKLNPNILIVLGVSLLILSSCTTPKKITQTTKEQYEVSPVIVNNPETSLKRKIAIARFSNETTYGKSIFYDKANDPLGKQAMDILSAKLASTNRFILFERSDLDKIMDEMKIDKQKPDSILINADFLVIGSVSEFGRNVEGEVGVLSRSKTQTARATVNIRLVDVYTGQIIYSEEASGEASSEAKQVLGVGGQAGYNETLNDRAISAAISKLVNNVIQNLLDKPWRSYILDISDGSIIISGGLRQGLTENKELAIIEKGKKVKNPQTNMLIELPGKEIGRISVVAFSGDNELSEISICKKVSGIVPTSNFTNYYIQEIK